MNGVHPGKGRRALPWRPGVAKGPKRDPAQGFPPLQTPPEGLFAAMEAIAAILIFIIVFGALNIFEFGRLD